MGAVKGVVVEEKEDWDEDGGRNIRGFGRGGSEGVDMVWL